MRDQPGATLIEAILSIILIGIIGIVVSEVFLSSTKMALTGHAVREATQVNRLGLDRMIREIGNVRNNQCVAAADKQFTFVDSNNRTIGFSWSGTAVISVGGSPLSK